MKIGSKEDLLVGLGLAQETLKQTADLLEKCISAEDPVAFAVAMSNYVKRLARDKQIISAYLAICCLYITHDPENN